MLLWNPEHFLPRTSGPKVRTATLYFAVQVTGPSATHEVSVVSDGEWEETLGRVLGCFLLASMPRKGIWEALSSLKEIYEFNTESTRYMLPEPKVRTGRGKVVSVLEAPALNVQEG